MDSEEREVERAASMKARWLKIRGWAIRGLAGLVLVLLGVAGGVVWSERRASQSLQSAGSAVPKGGEGQSGQAMPRSSAGGQPDAGASDKGAGAKEAGAGAREEEPVEVSLTREAAERAGIKTTRARGEMFAVTITVPGTVMSNAYRDTKVNAIVGGIVRRVGVELGQPVTRGQELAVIFSNELAEAQMKYLSMHAMLTADHQKLDRTEQLAAIGAASRQELEEITAAHHAHETEVAAARQRLLLLGLAPGQIEALRDASHVVSEVIVAAPSDGLIIARTVNAGQVVGAGQELFTVTDLSSVWVIGDLYEKDFASVRVGSEAAITMPFDPRGVLRGRVSYIDPRVDAATRTAKVRVDVPNRRGDLRLGMYVSVSFRAAAGAGRTLIPKTAVQMLGDRAVVYVPVPGRDHRFAERPVRLGAVAGDSVQVLEGLEPDEHVVTDGSFLLRAEAAKTRSGS